jgi:hypothetical protein
LYQKIINNKDAFKDSYEILNAMDKIAKIDNA